MQSLTRMITAGLCGLALLWAGCDAGGPDTPVPEAHPPGTFTMDVTGALDLDLQGSARFTIEEPPSAFFEPRLEIALTDSTFGTVAFNIWRPTLPPPGSYLICNVPACAGQDADHFVPVFLHADPYRWASGWLEIKNASAGRLSGTFALTTLSAREDGSPLARFAGAFHAVRGAE